ncbi:hypothetical protein KIL84_021587 [Mauremys mutica]|uniref:Uncharacterized protein n=1 Tax=Mauremys mutica TaxID=74926 RepID=A0A9D3X8Y3_9SAUR|nr:hypothetical protein KIL84_021587 [Mauremys mutica]
MRPPLGIKTDWRGKNNQPNQRGKKKVASWVFINSKGLIAVPRARQNLGRCSEKFSPSIALALCILALTYGPPWHPNAGHLLGGESDTRGKLHWGFLSGNKTQKEDEMRFYFHLPRKIQPGFAEVEGWCVNP